MLHHEERTDYTDIEAVRAEVAAARRLFTEQQWPVIDVTRRSIEETAAAILKLLARRAARTEDHARTGSSSWPRRARRAPAC